MTDCVVENNSTKFPSWIQSTLFEDLLKSLYEDFEKISDFNVENALAPGENYATLMLKVDIKMLLKDSSSQSASFMLKVVNASEAFEDFVKGYGIFDVESGMFHSFLPEFEKLYADIGLKVKFGAKSYKLPTEEKYVLLENLKEQGFKNADRLKGLNKTHTESVLKKLAQYHAASAVRVESKGPFPEEYRIGFIKPSVYDAVKGLFDGNTKTFLECVKEFKGSELYYDKVAKIQNSITDELFKFAEADPSEFNVLNHGDCWSNNIMFKYDDQGNILDTYFVDLQIPRYASPAQDLLYFLLSSTELEIKLKDFDYFIKFYHDNLIESLKILNYSSRLPTLKEIHQMIYKYGAFGYMAVAGVLGVVLCDPTENATLDNFFTDSDSGVNFKRQMYLNPRFRAHMEAILPWLLNKGVLDC